MKARVLTIILLVSALTLLLTLARSTNKEFAQARIINGVSVPNAAQRFPWFAMTGGCGGALISPRLVLTAAHCVDDIKGQPVLIGTQRIGTYGQPVGGEVRTIVEVYRPSNTIVSNGSMANDIALLKLDKPSTKTPIRLQRTKVSPNQVVTVIGYGRTASRENPESSTPNVLQIGQGLVTTSADCLSRVNAFLAAAAHNKTYNVKNLEAAYKNDATNPNYYCVKNTTTRPMTACFGDSGGPLFIDMGSPETDRLVGCVHGGLTKCQINKISPAASAQFFTKVATNMTWIQKIAASLGERLRF